MKNLSSYYGVWLNEIMEYNTTKPKFIGRQKKVYEWLLGAGEEENGELLNEYRVSVLQDEKVLETGCITM